MKYAKIFAAAVSAILFSCVKEQPLSDSPLCEGRQISQITATFADAESKTVIADDGNSVLWSPGDEINIFYGASGMKFTSMNTTPSASSLFSAEKSIMFIGGESSKDYIWGVYPFSDNNSCKDNCVTLSIPSGQTAVKGSFSKGCFPSIGRSHTTSISFFNVCGGVCFSLTQPDVQCVTFKGNNNEILTGVVKVQFNESNVPEITEVVSGSSCIQLNAPTSAGFEVGKLYYFSILPQTLSGGFTMEFNKASAKATINNTSSVTVKRSIFGKLADADKGIEYVSTSTRKDLSSAGTANCYIVNKSGHYKFKATVKGGSSETVGTPATGEVLWESFGTDVVPQAGDLVSSVSLDNGYVKFSSGDKNGNAVIAVRDAFGKILWSWHIWVCKDFDPSSTAQVYKNSAGTMMDRNLGATSTKKGDVCAHGLLYQWGRKDPFLGSSSISGKSPVASTLSWPAAEDASAHLLDNNTLSYSVSHPTTYLKNGTSPYDWYCSSSTYKRDNLWSATKTMYDPCPKGWRVPGGGSNGVWAKAFGQGSSSSSEPWDSTNRGMDFGSGNGQPSTRQLGSAVVIWYPAAGAREFGDDSLSNVGAGGYCWSCTNYSFYAYCLVFTDLNLVGSSDYVYRAYGQSVRCVAE